jgi:adenine-specific DNA-methyltransferase
VVDKVCALGVGTVSARQFRAISVHEWREDWNRHLRPFLVSEEGRRLYREIAADPESCRFGELATIGIGYVSGTTDFFHLRPSAAARWDSPGLVRRAAQLRNRRPPAWRRDAKARAPRSDADRAASQ